MNRNVREWHNVLHFKRKKRGDLAREVKDGKCFLKIDSAGKVARIVSVAVLLITRADGKELVDI